jgi:hypothetical protein
MRKLFLPICLSISLVPALFAVDQKPAPPAQKTKPADSSAPAEAKNKASDESSPISVKNKSSFQLDAATRNPFWPIGFKPKAHIGGSGDAEGEVPASAFLLTSITVDGATHFAIINGKPMAEGQHFGLQVGTQIYQVTVKRIEDGRVILGRRDEEIVVPLRRK